MTDMATNAGPAEDQSARDKAGEKAGEARDAAQEKAQEAQAKVQEKAGEAREQARGRVREEVDRRSSEAGEQVASTAQTIRRVGDSLRDEGNDGPARMAAQAADRTERLGSYLKDSDADRILGDVEDFARRQPWVMALGGIALGVAAARFMKASSSERYRSRGGGERPSGNGHSPGVALPPPSGTAAGPAVPPVGPPGGVEPPPGS